METGLAVVTGRMVSLLPAERAAALTGGPVTIDLDATDVEVSADLPRYAACIPSLLFDELTELIDAA